MAALILIALTGFNAVCRALTRLGVPRLFVVQLLLFYRYIFVLVDEAERMEMARSLRSFDSQIQAFQRSLSPLSDIYCSAALIALNVSIWLCDAGALTVISV